MHNFDFHILEPKEFERLVADLVTARVSIAKHASFIVKTQSGGPDGGVDFKIDNGEIIGQAKRIKEKRKLFKILRKEVAKVKALEPERYILIVSIDLTFKERDQIIELFSPFIRDESDLLDKVDLNCLLEDHKDILLRHNKLWLSSTHILKELISDAVREGVDSLSGKNTVAELQEINRVREYFVSTKYFPQGIDILREMGFLIITGEPGIGKTTLARALCHYFMEEGGYRKLFYHHGINPPLYMPDVKEKSIFFIDDFLGSNIYDKARMENISFFEQFVDKLYKDGHLLILTTREYIYQQEKKVNPRFRRLDIFKQTISHGGYSKEEKLQILLNNVAKAELPYPAVQSLKVYADSIIESPNYRPKLIAEFLRKRNNNIPDMQMWGWFLYYHMNVPHDYWELAFLDLSEGAKLFVLCLFISNQPAYHYFLYDTFKSVSRFRPVSKAGYEGDIFNEAVRELNGTFIIIDKDIQNDKLVYSFETTTIVDFLLSYLKNHDYLIEPLIKGAITFDQLFFAFTTRKDDYVTDEDGDEPAFGEKILLNKPLQELFIEKVTTEFDELKEEKVDMVKWGPGELVIQKRYREINRVKWLKLLFELFNPNSHFKVGSFLKKKVKEVFLWENESTYLLDEETSQLPDFVISVKKYLKVDPKKVIEEYCWNMRRTEDYNSLYKLRRYAPKFFDTYINNHKTEFFRNLKDVIYNDIIHFKGFVDMYTDYYKWLQLNKLFDYVILKVHKLYKLKLSETAWKKWLKLAGMNYRDMKMKGVGNNRYIRKERVPADIMQAINKVLPLPEKSLSRMQLYQVISDRYPTTADKIMSILQKRKYLYKIIRTELQLAAVINFCTSNSSPLSKNKAGFIRDYFGYELRQMALSSKDGLALVEFVGYAHKRNLEFFKKNDMYECARAHNLNRVLFDKIANSALLTLNNTWYSFTIPEVRTLLKAISFLNVPNKVEHYKTYTFYYDDDGFRDMLPYIDVLDHKDFLQHFVSSRVTGLYRVLNVRGDKNIIIRYFEYFDAKLQYRRFKRGIKCTITVERNKETCLLLDYLNFWIGEEMFKKFPYNSSYVMSGVNRLKCSKLINYISDTLPPEQSIEMSSIRDERFWELLLVTDWAQAIKEEIPKLKLLIIRIKEMIGKYKEQVVV